MIIKILIKKNNFLKNLFFYFIFFLRKRATSKSLVYLFLIDVSSSVSF
jgi:hypothetical protein